MDMMKLVITFSFMLGFICAIVQARAFGGIFNVGNNPEGVRRVKRDLPPFPQEDGSGTNRMKSVDEEAIDLLRRLTREAAKPGKNVDKAATCKYRKGSWSACDPVSKVRTRSDSLRKGDANVCESVKTRTKECNKGGKKTKQRKNGKVRIRKE